MIKQNITLFIHTQEVEIIINESDMYLNQSIQQLNQTYESL